MTKQAFRLRFTFWLNMTKPDEEAIAETISDLKQMRLFSQTIRDGIRLICDLRAGRLDVLFELFPWVRAEFLEYMQSLQTPGGNDDDGKVADIQRQLHELERLLLSQDGGQVMAPAGPKPLAVPNGTSRPAPPPDDDDMPELVIVQAKSDGNASANFLASSFALIQQ